jgi:hypothetical protein
MKPAELNSDSAGFSFVHCRNIGRYPQKSSNKATFTRVGGGFAVEWAGDFGHKSQPPAQKRGLRGKGRLIQSAEAIHPVWSHKLRPL